MDQHPIPRQITTFEFKLIGFMTLRQFLFLAVFFPVGYIVYKVVPIPVINILLGVVVGAIGAVFAFIPIQDRPMEVFIKNLIRRLNSPTQYFFHKKSDSIPLIEELYFTSDPHIALTHIETKDKLNAYLQSTKNTDRELSKDLLTPSTKQQTHIAELLKQTKHTSPVQIKKSEIGMSVTPSNEGENTVKQPFVTGVVKNRKQIPLPGIMVEIKDTQGTRLRLLKTNPHGVFATYSALSPGEYVMDVSDPKGGYFFDTMNVHIDSDRFQPITVYSREVL